MRTVVILTVGMVILSRVALAQQSAPPSIEQVSEQANSVIKVLQDQRNNAMDQAAAAHAAANRAAKDLADAKKEILDLKTKEAPKLAPKLAPAPEK